MQIPIQNIYFENEVFMALVMYNKNISRYVNDAVKEKLIVEKKLKLKEKEPPKQK